MPCPAPDIAPHESNAGANARGSYIAEAINEMKTTTWMKKVVGQYLLLCEFLALKPQSVPRALPNEYEINSKWLGNLFASDAEARREEVRAELDAEKGHDLSETLNEAVI